MNKKLVRPKNNRIIAGVSSGIAQYFGISTVGVRIIFFLLLILPPAAIVPYLILWLIMPSEKDSQIVDVK